MIGGEYPNIEPWMHYGQWKQWAKNTMLLCTRGTQVYERADQLRRSQFSSFNDTR